MPKRALTAAASDRLKPPSEGQVEHFDAGYPGLAFRLSYGGARSWVYFYRAAGKQRRLTLGAYPALSLAQAREAWRTARAAVERGEDPANAKAEAKRREPDTVQSVAEDFIARYARPRNRTGDEVARMFALHLYPKLGTVRIEKITRRDILDLLDGIEAKASPTRANRVLANIKRLFSWSVERGILEASPVASIRAPGAEVARDRVLSDDELRAFLRGCDAMGEPFGHIFRLLLLTAQRRDEVAGALWSELDLPGALWSIPASRTKNKRLHSVPLAPQSVENFESVMRLGPLVFPARFSRSKNGEPRCVSGFGRAVERLDGLMLAELRKADPEAMLPDWRLHDLRRTAASGMARLGVPVHVVEKLLNHVSGTFHGVVGVYQRHDFAEEKRSAAQAWANFLDSLTADTPANVVQLAYAR